jgi:pilus assembly protein TadC
MSWAAALLAALAIALLGPLFTGARLPTAAHAGTGAAAADARSATAPRHREAAPRGHAAPLRRSRREHLLDQCLPDLLDLLVVTLQAGLPAAQAFRSVAPLAPAPLAGALHELVERLDRGDRLVTALPLLSDRWGVRALSLVGAVSAAELSGQPLAPVVDRLADDGRHQRRRAAEADARRLPVRLAVPLACCTLPSFVCIAIGPLVIGALSSLRAT